MKKGKKYEKEDFNNHNNNLTECAAQGTVVGSIFFLSLAGEQKKIYVY